MGLIKDIVGVALAPVTGGASLALTQSGRGKKRGNGSSSSSSANDTGGSDASDDDYLPLDTNPGAPLGPKIKNGRPNGRP
jgi:hypothetical protein